MAVDDKRKRNGRSIATTSDDLNSAVDELKRFAELVSRLALQPCDSTALRELRLEALSDLCLAARQLSDDDTFRSLFDMALLHASNRLYEHRPDQAKITTTPAVVLHGGIDA